MQPKTDSASCALVERFFSVQGEGANAGRAAFFIRFAGCNLDCKFADGSICDTPWQKAKFKRTVNELVAWVAAEVERLCAFATGKADNYMVVLTGGEPTLAPAFDELVGALRQLGAYVAVETNGTHWRDGLLHCNWVTVSPKYMFLHGPAAQSRVLDDEVVALPPHEYRYVIADRYQDQPPFQPAIFHYVSPAMRANGTGLEYTSPTPVQFVPGAVERCLEIVKHDPRWCLSLQTQKWIRVP